MPFPYDSPDSYAPPTATPPTLFGVPIATEFYKVQELGVPSNIISPGTEIEFIRNSVVTGISLIGWYSSFAGGQDPAIEVDIVKDGHEHLCTDGKVVQRLSPQDVRFTGGAYLPVWIPVDAGEKWTANVRRIPVGPAEIPLSYLLSLRVERLLEKPISIPKLTQTVIYKARFDAGSLGSGAVHRIMRELDFRTDGVVTGIRTTAIPTSYDSSVLCFPAYEDHTWDILMSGTRHLGTTGKGTSQLNTLELHNIVDWQRMWQPVDRHEKWQIMMSDNDRSEVEARNFLVRVEEGRRPWERW